MTVRACNSPDISQVSHLEFSATGERYENDRLHGLSRAGAHPPVRYDLSAIAAAVTTTDLAAPAPKGCYDPRTKEFLSQIL